jgi:hypothetical protein
MALYIFEVEGGWPTVAGSYIMRVTMGDSLVWALKLDPSLHQDTIGKPTSTIKGYRLV